jgi:hypothetical protein
VKRVPFSDAHARVREAERQRVSLHSQRGWDPEVDAGDGWRVTDDGDELFRRHESSETERRAA